MTPHPLDRPIWNSLETGWAEWAQGDARARRIDPAYNVFGAAADDSDANQAALAALVPVDGEMWVVEPSVWPTPPGCRVERVAPLVQMIWQGVLPEQSDDRVIDLDEGDAPAMQALATLTKPGPFAEHTSRLGSFVGIRDQGRLVAMAGERMALPGWREVSAVCTDPDYRGRGLAGVLIRVVAARMIARGETPWLTSYAGNTDALALYEALGFRHRREMTVTVLAQAI